MVILVIADGFEEPGLCLTVIECLKTRSYIKIELSLCLFNYHTMKTFEVVEVQLHAFLTSALDGGEWSTSRLGRFTSGERAPGTHRIGGWMDPRAGLVAVVKRKIPQPLRGIEPRSSNP